MQAISRAQRLSIRQYCLQSDHLAVAVCPLVIPPSFAPKSSAATSLLELACARETDAIMDPGSPVLEWMDLFDSQGRQHSMELDGLSGVSLSGLDDNGLAFNLAQPLGGFPGACG